MNAHAENSFLPESSDRKRIEAEITLGMLSAVEENNIVSQRSIAKELGVALGLVNAYLKRCVAKGLIKVTTAPANRYVYYLTPQGFAEKSRLTAQYLSLSFDFFRTARDQCRELILTCQQHGWTRVVLCGRSELAEIIVLCADGDSIKLVGLVDADDPSPMRQLPVFGDLTQLPQIDAAIITDQRKAQETYERMVTVLPRERVLTPRILNVSRMPPTLAEQEPK
jgi:DNA-binding MarR family transcriptional regulator